MRRLLFLCLLLVLALSKIYFQTSPNTHESLFAIDAELLRHQKSHQLRKHLSEHFGPKHFSDSDFSKDPYTFTKPNQSDDDYPYLQKLKNLCLDGKDGLKGVEKLQAFRKGICSPVMLTPGILGTALVVEIDCEKLKAFEGGTIFKQCGWNSCTNFIGNKPAENYILWVGVDLMLKPLLGERRCFGQLLGLRYNKSLDGSGVEFGSRYYEADGVKSTWFGNNQYSKDISQCGANAIGDLAGVNSILKIMGSQCAVVGYKRTMKFLKYMGYETGVTMQPVPYDFRKGILAGETTQIIPQVINNLYYMTGKKVVVVAHSLGTLHTLESLSFFMTKEEKDKMVRHYIPITPPWFGTVSAIRNVIIGDSSYWNPSTKMGINFFAQMRFTRTAGSASDLFLRDAFKTYRNTTWMKEILKRIDYENQQGNQNQTKYPLSWFPGKNENCFSPIYKADPSCKASFIDFEKTPIFTVEGKHYYGNRQNITQLIKDTIQQSAATVVLEVWNQTKVVNKSLDSIPAPGVDTSMIFSTLFDTQIYYVLDKNPKNISQTQTGNFYPNEVIRNTPGDQSVPSFSPLIFITKWLAEGNNNRSVQAIEYCGKYQGDKEHYSVIIPAQPQLNTYFYYQTLTCSCVEDPFHNPNDCVHACIISDIYLIQFIIGILTNSDRGYQEPGLADAIRINSGQILSRLKQCYNLQPYSKISGETRWRHMSRAEDMMQGQAEKETDAVVERNLKHSPV